jgi:O-methyltransferase involved in polyketide biosynthesis
MNTKEKALLTEEQETLLVPLYCKAQEGNPIFVDEKAQEILRGVEYNFTPLNIPPKTCMTLCIRAKQIDTYTRKFLTTNPNSVVVHLGCGLDSRYLRVGHGDVEWYDLDMPAVIELRRKFYKETDKYHLIASSVTDLRWVATISTKEQPVLVIAEGLLMYLTGEAVRTLVLKLKEAFPGCELIFDAYSTMTTKRIKDHPAIKKTGASVRWGIDDPRTIEQWADDIHLQEEWYFTQAEDIDKLGWGYRFGFKLAGLFATARRAHRILYYTLA